MNLKEFLQTQTKRYQCHMKAISSLEKALQHQIKTGHSIPARYRPQMLYSEKQNLNEVFAGQFDHLFSQYLQQVITSNTITLQNHKSALEEITKYTEEQLRLATISNEMCTNLYEELLKENEIGNHSAIPVLQKRLERDTEASPVSKSKKRKLRRKCLQNCQVPCEKRLKISEDNFLFRGHPLPQTPT